MCPFPSVQIGMHQIFIVIPYKINQYISVKEVRVLFNPIIFDNHDDNTMIMNDYFML